jgi:hypothetical protein
MFAASKVSPGTEIAVLGPQEHSSNRGGWESTTIAVTLADMATHGSLSSPEFYLSITGSFLFLRNRLPLRAALVVVLAKYRAA